MTSFAFRFRAIRIRSARSRAAAFAVLAAFAALLPLSAAAQEVPSPARLRADIETLAGFGSRHTLSEADDPEHGIGAARRWAMAALARIGDACDCIEVANVARGFEGPAAPEGAQVIDVLGFQAGAETHRVVIVAARLDSPGIDPAGAAGQAPDDGAGVALVLETARILSRETFRATIVYALLTGEEQGLWGSTLLAETARAAGWRVSAVLLNESVPGAGGDEPVPVRVVAEPDPASPGSTGTLPAAVLARDVAAASPPELGVTVATAEPGRPAHPLASAGYPVVRLLAGAAQPEALAPLAALNAAAVRRVARAPAAPDAVTLGASATAGMAVRWAPVEGAAGYRIHWRRNDAQDWTDTRDVTGTEAMLDGLIVDDLFVGVSALAEDGSESLVTFATR